MIFVTVGTHHQPFERLLRALATIDDDLVVQYGPGDPPAGVLEAQPFMPFDRIIGLMSEADKVITHAGVGSILCARRAGHLPLVVPRRHRYGEHVDEHQAELVRALERERSVAAAWDCDELAEILARVPVRGAVAADPDPQLAAAVRAALA